MMLPPVVRVFFALELPEVLKQKIGEYISALKKKSKPHAIRWTRKDNLHITLQFLAEVRSEDLASLIDKVHNKIKKRIKPLEFKVGELQLFPTPFRPRVIVLEITPLDALAELATLIGKGIVENKYQIDERPFRAHLTLGRIKQPQGLDLSYLTQVTKPAWEPVPLSEVVLFRSEPHSEGSIYTALSRLALAGGDGTHQL